MTGHVRGEAQPPPCVTAVRNRVMGYTEVSRGTVNASRLTPREVVVVTIQDARGGDDPTAAR